MRQEILKILKEIRGDIDFSKETQLLTDEIFDSFDIISLLAEISEKLNIEIDVDDITEENFNSYELICKYLENQNERNKGMNITEGELWAKERALFDLKYPAEEVVRFLKKNFKEPQSKTILDFGCGSGRNTIPMVDMGFKKVIAMDYNQSCLELTREKLKDIQNVEYIQNEERMTIPLEDNSIDVIVAYGVLFLFTETERALFAKEMYRVLKAGGKICADFRGLEDKLFGLGREIEHNLFLLDERADQLYNMRFYFCDDKDLYNLYEQAGFSIENMERKLQWINNLKDKVDHYIVWLVKNHSSLKPKVS